MGAGAYAYTLSEGQVVFGCIGIGEPPPPPHRANNGLALGPILLEGAILWRPSGRGILGVQAHDDRSRPRCTNQRDRVLCKSVVAPRGAGHWPRGNAPPCLWHYAVAPLVLGPQVAGTASGPHSPPPRQGDMLCLRHILRRREHTSHVLISGSGPPQGMVPVASRGRHGSSRFYLTGPVHPLDGAN